MRRHYLFYLFVGLTGLLLWGVANAGNLSVCGVCDGFRLVQKGSDLLVMCPGTPQPFLTYKNCTKPKARLVKGVVQLQCSDGTKVLPLDTTPPPGK